MGVSTLHLVRKMRGEVDYTTNARNFVKLNWMGHGHTSKKWHVIHQTYRISNNTTKFYFYHGTPRVKWWFVLHVRSFFY